MVIISTVSYPPESAQQMAQRFLETPQIPSFLSLKGPYISSKASPEGIVAISVCELDNANLAAGLEFLGSFHAIFFGVPGFRYETKPFFNVEESMKIIGMG